MKKKFLATTVLSLCLIALGALPAAAAPKDRLVVGIVQGARNLDPQSTTMGVTYGLTVHINETLVTIKNGKVVPLLAESWEILDDKVTYVFTLKQGVKFHNGETMTTDDVVFSFKRAKSPAGVAIKALSMYLTDVEKVDDRTVKLTAVRPMGEAFLGSLSHPWASILSQKAVESSGLDYGQKPVGTGKFKLKHWVPGDRVELERFDDYHGQKAKLNTILFRTIIEATSRTIELESGAVDVIMDLAPVDINRIKDDPKLEVVAVPSYRHYYVGIDVNLKPFDNPKVREALNYALNRAGMIKVVFRGHAEVARGPLPSTITYSNYANAEDLAYDPAKAKKLLAEAGFPNGFKTEIMISDRTDYLGLSTIMQNNLKEIGIDAQIKVYEAGAFHDAMRKPLHTPFINNWGGNVPSADPFFSMNPLFHSNNSGQTNRSFYKNPDIDALLDKGVETTDPAERQAIYTELWDKLNSERPHVWILTPLNMYGKVRNLKGIDFSPTVINYFSDAYFE